MGVDTVGWLVNFGALGVVLLLILTRVLVPGWVHTKLEDAHEKLQAAYDQRGEALALERQRNSDLQSLAAAGTKAMTALAEIAEEQRRQQRTPGPRTPPEGTPALSGGPPP